MHLRNWLLAGTGLGLLAATAAPAFAQDSLGTAYQLYLAAQAGGDAGAQDAAKTALTNECIIAGYPSFEECLATLNAAANPAPAAEAPPAEAPIEQPAAEAPPIEQPAAEAPPVEEPPPVEEQPAVEQPPIDPPKAEQPPVDQPPAEQPAVEQPPADQPPAVDPAVEFQNNLNAELANYQKALDLAAAGDLANAQPMADAASANILAICNAANYPTIEACIGQSLPALPQPAPAEQPAPEQPAAETQPTPVPPPAGGQLASPEQMQQDLGAQVDAYNQAVAAGDAAGQQAATANIQALCIPFGYASVEECVATYGLTLSAAAAPPSNEPPTVTDTPATAVAPPSEPVPEQLLDQVVNSDAVEALPADVSADVAAPLLDSAKDASAPGAEAETPAAPGTVFEAPTSDTQAQLDIKHEAPPPPVAEETGHTIDAPVFLPPQASLPTDTSVQQPQNGTGFVLQFNTELFFENPTQDRDRIWNESEDEIFYEQLSRGRVKETIVRPDGVQIVTIRSADGDILRRSRITADGREYILAYVDETEEIPFEDGVWHDPGQDLPPLRLTISARDYVLDADEADQGQVEDFFSQPPVEQVRRIYTIEDVKRSARIRDSVRRLEIGGLTFDSGKATISRTQVGALANVANAMLDLLDRNPAETFLIEGHTDAVGTDVANLGLSDLRASTVARILTDFYHIPPENLTTQGYGERYLKVRTEAAERLNRRVTIRRITPLITLASN